MSILSILCILSFFVLHSPVSFFLSTPSLIQVLYIFILCLYPHVLFLTFIFHCPICTNCAYTSLLYCCFLFYFHKACVILFPFSLSSFSFSSFSFSSFSFSSFSLSSFSLSSFSYSCTQVSFSLYCSIPFPDFFRSTICHIYCLRILFEAAFFVPVTVKEICSFI